MKINKYITTGELARLADTTKRTIMWYAQKGILKPIKTGDNNYRFYEEKQVLDYQMILLLTTFGVGLDDISCYLKNKGELKSLFISKKLQIKKQIKELQFRLNSIEKIFCNLSKNKTMVNPQVKKLKPFGIYYIDKVGSYSKISCYCRAISEMFLKKGKDFTTMAIFEDIGYRPKKSRMKIGVIAKSEMEIKKEFRDILIYMKFKPGKVLRYTHNGSGSLLSLFWQELKKYSNLNNLTIRKNTPQFEIYRKTSCDLGKQFFEIFLPIE